MLAKKNRFHGPNALHVAYKNSKTARHGSLNLRYKPNQQSSFRTAVVISKKVDKSAVVRNRIRRRIFEWVRLNVDQKPVLQSNDLIIGCYDKSLASISSSELTKSLNTLFDKAKK